MIRFEFSHLGPMEVGELALSDLTILCGENNTGKTYVTYLVYCMLATWRQFIDLNLSDALDEIENKGIATIDLQTFIVDKWENISKTAVNKFSRNLPEMLASKTDNFKDFHLDIVVPLGKQWKEKEYKQELRSGQGNLLIALSKAENSSILEIAAPNVGEERLSSIFILGDFIEEKLFSLMLEDVLPKVFIASTERTGATTFKKQLNLATGNLLDLLSQIHKEGADSVTPRKLFETMYERKDYALPVEHNVKFINSLPSINSEEGELFKLYPSLIAQFEGIVGGTFVTNKDNMTYFVPKGTRLSLGLGEVSSSVRSLMLVWYWLKYVGKKGDMLMLDEPELNLHPNNQRRLARFIAALINHGVKVFLTTHSDYIIREFNTLIMLNQADLPSTLLEKLPDYTDSDKLSFERINVYIAKEDKVLKPNAKRRTLAKTIVKADVSATLGIEAISFDETIDAMNAVQEAIYYANH
jgi:hypothetical protein